MSTCLIIISGNFLMSKSILLSKPNSAYIKDLKNRIAMSAMTRSFAIDNKCNSDMSDYYIKRAKNDVSFILTEGIIVHSSGDGYVNVPHMETKAQSKSWIKTTDTVHDYGSKIYAQLWHCGRISHEDFTNGEQIISSSSIQAEGLNRQNGKAYGIPRSIKESEMKSVYSMFSNATSLALEANFDGVQIHMGHGYLIDQFFDSRINSRDDFYGGSIENRCRFSIELLDGLLKEFGSEKIMVRISPSRNMNGIYEWPNLTEMLNYLINKFDDIGLRQLDISCANSNYFETSGKIIRMIRKIWPYFLIGGASLSISEAENEVSSGYLDLVTWGRAILANPDFVKKVESGREIIPFTDSMRKTLN